MIDFIVGLYILFTIASSFMIYRRHCLKPRYRPLKEAGLLMKPTGLHLLHAMARRKGDPLRRLQLELGIYGLVHVVVIFVLWAVGFAIFGFVESCARN